MHQDDEMLFHPPLGELMQRWQRDHARHEDKMQDHQQTLEAILAPDHPYSESIGKGCADALFTGLVFFRGMQNVYVRVMQALLTLPETPTRGQVRALRDLLRVQQAKAEQDQQRYRSDTLLLGFSLAEGMNYAYSRLIGEMEAFYRLVEETPVSA